MVPPALLPLSDSVCFQTLDQDEDHFHLKLTSKSPYGICPECGEKTSSKHSTYIRKISDLPWAGIPVKVNLCVRKYYCRNEECKRKIFTERLGEKLRPYARRTARLTQHLNKIGCALGGNAGASLARFIGIPVSSSTVLRVLHRTSTPSFESPIAVGIDDWAYRKGKTYGTIVVDLEKRKPIDLLPDREAETVEKWLRAHPNIQIVSRDRGSNYIQGATDGAPQAIQVADRWHLLKNMGEALKRMLDGYNKELRQAAREVAEARTEASSIEEVMPSQAKSAPKEVEEKSPSKFQLLFEEVKKLQAKGVSIREISRRLSLGRQTVTKYFKHETYPRRATVPSIHELDPYKEYLLERWKEEGVTGLDLWKELHEKGFRGSLTTFYIKFRALIGSNTLTKNKIQPVKIKVWSSRRMSFLLSRDPQILQGEELNYVETLLKINPKIQLASHLARRFAKMVNSRENDQLDDWINKALESGVAPLKNFAVGLQSDYDAVKAALSLKWSNGQVEGQVNRLKTIKRQMYGRASFELLRKRVLMDSS